MVNMLSRVLNPVRVAAREKLQRAVSEAVAGVVRPEVDRAVNATRDFEMRSRRDLFAAGERDAAVSTARLVHQEMASARMLPDPIATLNHALSLAPAEGMALEFGVYSGKTLTEIARSRKGVDVYGFDSFEGLPEHWRAGFPEGTFGGEMLPDGPPQVEGAELVVGWFDQTLPRFLDAHPGPVAFLHVDCDIYSSTKTVLELVGPRLRKGSVVVFDEFFNYPGWQFGEYRAWGEHVDATGWKFSYEAFTIDNEQVAVRLTDVGPGVDIDRFARAPQAAVQHS
ncbi:class I SAM-dependent methyltransferase [Saccharopolyspora sp. TS4A08]|uniref:Class I SAM-dependent methyltransferase n=2 Tax=Saccharopolyspora ipomoeae TaxID=3042027 RepID=A0ABT6PNP1_9PSEU|nr:class I SAM-dependent methyltransferase [Saccharopolyspora sp. TS4A08]MDI2029629.1 class I SAM-dependent methyltransferase [Saccharopolyspora sp. TS4A08]